MNLDDKKYDYDWIYKLVDESFIEKRKEVLKRFERFFFLVFLVVFLYTAIAIFWLIKEFSLFKLASLIISLYLSGVLFLVFISLLESFSFNRSEAIEKCLKVLRTENINLRTIEKFERRASADIGAARVFVVLPSLVLTVAGPVFFLSSTNLDVSGGGTLFNEIPDILRNILFSPDISSFFLESISFAVLLLALLLLSASNLYYQLERANISTVIQHACIEFGVELEAQNASPNGAKN